jgi:hypothetical protein
MVYLPSEIQTLLDERGHSQPEMAVRALNSLSGDLGEAYLMLIGDDLIVLSRQIGRPLNEIIVPKSSVSSVEAVEDRPFAYLRFQADGVSYDLKFSGMDFDEIKSLATELTSPTDSGEPAGDVPLKGAAPVDVVAAEIPKKAPPLTPIVGFCAAVYAMIQADSDIDDEELEFLNRLIDHPPTVLKGLDALRRLGTVELFAQLSDLMDDTQKLCMMANLVEMSMIDGLVRGPERRLLTQVREATGVEKSNYDAIFEILMIKNNRSVFEIAD